MNLSRRILCSLAPFSVPLAQRAAAATPSQAALPATFPMQAPELVREMVTVAHGNVKRVRELVEAHPSLAKAAWDWGFGDWETALGAASHVGNREIAEYLIAHGARPSLFSAAMLGQLDVVKAFVAAQPGVLKIAGPHSISLLAHASAGGVKAEPVLRYLESLGDAGAVPEAPLSDADATALAGSYVFGTGATEKIEITFAKNQLMFTRAGTPGRRLLHVGERAFFPAGAVAVRIRFFADGNALALTVHDPDLVLKAVRATG